MAVLRVGTSGYSFKEWKGSFYPEDLPDKKMLPYYARYLPSVEINYTFRRMPTATTLANWDAITPESFVFVLKASQRITHIQRLKDSEETVNHFVTTAAGLGPKLGPILFQLPPYFKKDSERLESFLQILPGSHRYAFEFRHPTWFDDEILELLRQREVSLCINETDEGAPALSVTAPYLYLRFRRESYEPEAITAWSAKLKGLVDDGVDVFAFFKHEREGPRLARALLEAAGAPIPAEPESEA
jgi:uncharacterized protein YecE (DUF72 family)